MNKLSSELNWLNISVILFILTAIIYRIGLDGIVYVIGTIILAFIMALMLIIYKYINNTIDEKI